VLVRDEQKPDKQLFRRLPNAQIALLERSA
jgi:hypothetical protein